MSCGGELQDHPFYWSLLKEIKVIELCNKKYESNSVECVNAA